MCYLRHLCLVFSLIIFTTVSQGEEFVKSDSLPVASAATLTRLKDKLAENAGRDAIIQCEVKEVNKLFMEQKWGESTFEFSGSQGLSVSSIPPQRKEFCERFLKAQFNENSKLRLKERYKLKVMGENTIRVPVPEKQNHQTGLEANEKTPFNLLYKILSGLDYDFRFESLILIQKAWFLLNSYEQTEKLCSSCTLYQYEDDLIWELIPRNKNHGEQFLILLDKQTLVPKRVRSIHPGNTSYDDLAIIKYEIK